MENILIESSSCKNDIIEISDRKNGSYIIHVYNELNHSCVNVYTKEDLINLANQILELTKE